MYAILYGSASRPKLPSRFFLKYAFDWITYVYIPMLLVLYFFIYYRVVLLLFCVLVSLVVSYSLAVSGRVLGYILECGL